MSAQVPRTPTPVSQLNAAKAVLALAPGNFASLSQDGARLLLAHIWFETRNGKGLQNFNPGNVMARGFKPNGEEYSVWSGNYWRPPWFADSSRPEHKLMLEGKEPSAFRSYPSLSEGLVSYFQNVSRKPAMVKALAAGSPNAFASAVKSSGYTPFAPDSLGSTLSRRMEAFKAEGFFNSLPNVKKSVGMVGGALVLGLVGFIFVGTMRGGFGKKKS